MYQCPQCHHSFRLRQATCEDRLDPHRCFGCPHCGVYLVRQVRAPQSAAILGGLAGGAGGGIGAASSTLVMRGLASGDTTQALLGGVIGVSTVVLFAVLLLAYTKAIVLAPVGPPAAAGA